MAKLGLSVGSKDDAVRIGTLLLQTGQIHRSEVKDKRKRMLEPVRSNIFCDDGYYFWLYEGSKFKRNVMLTMLIIVFTALCMFPIWTMWSKVYIWYISVTFLIFIVGLSTVRMLLFGILYCFGFDFWILPNLFVDELGFMDSITPVYSFARGKDSSEWTYRIATLVFFVGFGAWIYSQPTDYDEFLAQGQDFMDGLYSGTLLSDTAQTDKENIDKVIPNLEELERLEREAEEAERAEDTILEGCIGDEDADETEEEENMDDDARDEDA